MTRVVEVAEGVFEVPARLMGAIRTSHWLVVGERGALLVDPGVHGDAAANVVPALAELGLTADALVECVVTHADVDHAGGTSELLAVAPGCRVRAHRLERPLVESWPVCLERRYGWLAPHGLALADDTLAWMESAFGSPGPIQGDLADGDTIDVGGNAVVVVELPGHSPGLLGLWQPASRTLIAMDAVAGRGPDPAGPEDVTPPQYGSVAHQRATIERVRALDPAVLGSSHFAPLRGPDVAMFLEASAAFVDDLDAAVCGALGPAPRPLTEVLAHADAAVGPFRPDFFELARSVHAHLIDLEERGQAVRDTAGDAPRWRLV